MQDPFRGPSPNSRHPDSSEAHSSAWSSDSAAHDEGDFDSSPANEAAARPLPPWLAYDLGNGQPAQSPPTDFSPWSGDGHGKAADVSLDDPARIMPPWAGDGHGKEALPAFIPHDPVASQPTWMGDGHAGQATKAQTKSAQMMMTVNGQQPTQGFVIPPYQPVARLANPGPASKSDTWKLVCLVTFFFMWIAIASVLMFLYMDRYLFP